MRTVVIMLAAVVCVVAGPAGAAGGERAPREEIPLAEQLEGLAPEPRIAYLRYLLKTQGEDAEILFQLGVAFHELSRADSAIHFYERAVARDSLYTKAYVNMGVLYDDQGRIAKALHMFEEALRKNENDLLAYAHAAFIRFHLKDYATAWRYLDRALAIDPAHPQPHFYMAVFFWESGIYREAQREWERVVELDPDGYLAVKARENITQVQNVMNATAPSR
jgi:tetratricopeptide (TPR) repeat protein